MNALLQKVLNNIDQLTIEEKWQVISHVMDQLKPVTVAKPQQESDRAARVERAEKVLRETQGSWGNLSVDEVDAQLARQRLFDWGE